MKIPDPHRRNAEGGSSFRNSIEESIARTTGLILLSDGKMFFTYIRKVLLMLSLWPLKLAALTGLRQRLAGSKALV